MLRYGVYIASSSICSNEGLNFTTCSSNLIDNRDVRNLSSRVVFVFDPVFEHAVGLIVLMSNQRLGFMTCSFRCHTNGRAFLLV